MVHGSKKRKLDSLLAMGHSIYHMYGAKCEYSMVRIKELTFPFEEFGGEPLGLNNWLGISLLNTDAILKM